MDCTDSPTWEPQPFSQANFSFKENGPGVRYEIGVGIQCSWIVWVNGPFQPGVWTDDLIAKTQGLWQVLPGHEKFLADGGYSGWRAETPNGRENPDQWMKAEARARHEKVNGLFKRFKCLTVPFRHGFHFHGQCFHAIATVCQVEIEMEFPLFHVDYDDLRYSPYA